MPELLVNSRVESVAACWNAVRPWRSNVRNLELSGAMPPQALTEPTRPNTAADTSEKCIVDFDGVESGSLATWEDYILFIKHKEPPIVPVSLCNVGRAHLILVTSITASKVSEKGKKCMFLQRALIIQTTMYRQIQARLFLRLIGMFRQRGDVKPKMEARLDEYVQADQFRCFRIRWNVPSNYMFICPFHPGRTGYSGLDWWGIVLLRGCNLTIL